MTQLERKYEGLIKEVRSLEGDLADYNLAMDKARTGCVKHGQRACGGAWRRHDARTSLQDGCRGDRAVPLRAQAAERASVARRGRGVHGEAGARAGSAAPAGPGECGCRGWGQLRAAVTAAPASLRRSQSCSGPPRRASTRCRPRSWRSTAPSWARTACSGRRSAACSASSRRSTRRRVGGGVSPLPLAAFCEPPPAHGSLQVEAAESELRRDRVRDEYALLEKKVRTGGGQGREGGVHRGGGGETRRRCAQGKGERGAPLTTRLLPPPPSGSSCTCGARRRRSTTRCRRRASTPRRRATSSSRASRRTTRASRSSTALHPTLALLSQLPPPPPCAGHRPRAQARRGGQRGAAQGDAGGDGRDRGAAGGGGGLVQVRDALQAR